MKKLYLSLLVLIIPLFSCTNEDKNTSGNANMITQKKTDKQLNISILWDLSDRINPTKYNNVPSNAERDIAVLKYFANYFKADMEKRGAYFSKGKLKVFFSPNPTDKNINSLSAKLAVDLSAKDVKEKKQVYDHISANFEQTSKQIAEATIRTSTWHGADIYRFFKNDILDYCISRDTNYRNVLVVLTDGYVYDKNSKGKIGNKSEFILPSLLSDLGLRNNPDFRSVFETKNCGLIPVRNDLGNLDILVLEINPEENHKGDEDIIKLYLQKWFTDMNTRYFQIYNTDLPQNIENRIANFMAHTQ